MTRTEIHHAARLERDVARLKIYALVMTLAFGVLVLAAFTPRAPATRFEVIDVERLN